MFQNKIQIKKTRYEELDALRGCAALMVVLFFFSLYRPEAHFGFQLGTTGVDLFFLISGFVILMSIENVQKAGHFVINRVSRLYPTYWASVTFTSLILLIANFYSSNIINITLIEYIGNMTMFQFYLGIQDIDAPYWTMIIEMLFYIFILVIYTCGGLNHIIKIGFFSMLGIILIIYISDYNSIAKKIFEIVPLLQFWPLFFAGILFKKIINKSKFYRNYYALIFLCLLCQILLFKHSGRSSNFINIWEYSGMLILYFSLFLLFVNGSLKFIVNKTSLFLGKISFALYLTHQMISVGFIIPILCNKLNLNFWLAALIALLISIALSTFLTYFIEIPLSKGLKNRLYNLCYSS